MSKKISLILFSFLITNVLSIPVQANETQTFELFLNHQFSPNKSSQLSTSGEEQTIYDFKIESTNNNTQKQNFLLSEISLECSNDLYEYVSLSSLDSKNIEFKSEKFYPEESTDFTIYHLNNLHYEFSPLDNIGFKLSAKINETDTQRINICNLQSFKITNLDTQTELSLNQEIQNNLSGNYNYNLIQAQDPNYSPKNVLNLNKNETSQYKDQNEDKNRSILNFELQTIDNPILNNLILVCENNYNNFSNLTLEINNQTFNPKYTYNFNIKHQNTNLGSSELQYYYFQDINTQINSAEDKLITFKAKTTADNVHSINYCKIAKAELQTENKREDISSPEQTIIIKELYDIKGITDVSKRYYYYTPIKYLVDNNIINGYPDGTFKPSAKINRAELAKIIATNKLTEAELTETSCFDDVPEDSWYAKYVCGLKNKGWVNGYGETNQFRPEDQISKIEAIKIIIESLEIDLSPAEYLTENPYYDRSTDPNNWYSKYILKAQEIGLLKDYNWSKPDFHAKVIRGEISQYIYLAKDYQENSKLNKEFYESFLELGDIAYPKPETEPVLARNESKKNIPFSCQQNTFDKLEEVKRLEEKRTAHFKFADEKNQKLYQTIFHPTKAHPTPLGIAIDKGCQEIAKTYLDQDLSQLNNTQVYDGYAPIHIASQNKDFDMIKMLIDQGSNPNIQASHSKTGDIKTGYTPVHLIVDETNPLAGNEISILKYLIEHKANLNIISDYGYYGKTPLDIASNQTLKQFLIESGAISGEEVKIKEAQLKIENYQNSLVK